MSTHSCTLYSCIKIHDFKVITLFVMQRKEYSDKKKTHLLPFVCHLLTHLIDECRFSRYLFLRRPLPISILCLHPSTSLKIHINSFDVTFFKLVFILFIITLYHYRHTFYPCPFPLTLGFPELHPRRVQFIFFILCLLHSLRIEIRQVRTKTVLVKSSYHLFLRSNFTSLLIHVHLLCHLIKLFKMTFPFVS